LFNNVDPTLCLFDTVHLMLGTDLGFELAYGPEHVTNSL